MPGSWPAAALHSRVPRWPPMARLHSAQPRWNTWRRRRRVMPAPWPRAFTGTSWQPCAKQLLDEMKLEADRDDSLLRTRLFGSGMPLAEIERLTPQGFFVTLAQRLQFGGRAFERIDWLAAVPDSGGMVQMVGRARPPREMGSVRVRCWCRWCPGARTGRPRCRWNCRRRSTTLRAGRTHAPAAPAPAAAAGTGTAAPAAAAAAANPQAILDLLQAAEDNLAAARCTQYYDKQMSPNFRRTTAAKALRTLITACEKPRGAARTAAGRDTHRAHAGAAL